jgi:S-adenosylmethionine:tRNA ribosyltransferase-isomerase
MLTTTSVRTEELDFDLPQELIAQAPTPDRSASRLLHYKRSDRSIEHRVFADLPQLLRPGDLLVFNDAKVVPARFSLRKPTGGHVEGLFLAHEAGMWRVMLKNLGRVDPQAALSFSDEPELHAHVLEQLDAGQYRIRVTSDEPALTILARVGRMPLPPYIHRGKEHDARDDADRERYQTVYASAPGSVAAPTAGLHFTRPLLEELDRRGIQRTFLTLHVGLGTFKPVTADQLEDHPMHEEVYTIPSEAADATNAAKRENRRIIAVGTTPARVLESQPPDEPFAAKTNSTKIFIRPGYQWKHIDALITNFHLPRSTLIALVASFVGLAEQRRIYRDAIDHRYRFFSYGDASLLE